MAAISGGGGGGTGTTGSFQQSYDNSSPPVVVIGGKGALVLQARSSIPINAKLIGFKDKNGTVVGYVQADGLASFEEIVYAPTNASDWNWTNTIPDGMKVALDSIATQLATTTAVASTLAISLDSLTPTVLDTVSTAQVGACSWKLVLQKQGNRIILNVDAVHNGIGLTNATGAPSYTSSGGAIAGVVGFGITMDFSSSGSTQQMRLLATAPTLGWIAHVYRTPLTSA